MQHYVEDGYNADDMENIFNQSARILRTNQWEREVVYTLDGIRFTEPKCVRAGRAWHEREQARYPIHPIIRKALRMSRPDDWQLLLLQWPHESQTDKMRLAYTRDERSGEADRQVVTSLGKYLRAHFTSLPDHALRDLVALHSDSECKFIHTTAEMLYHLLRGPRSCMVWDADRGRHPYETYCPTLGWHMAVRIYDGDTVGRALCNVDKHGNKYFVRTYKKDPHNGYSNADETLAAWLKSQGYEHRGGYDWGTKLKHIPHKDYFLAPYLDGCNQEIDIRTIDSTRYLVIADCGEYTCNQTDGTTEEGGGEECADCGERFDDGDGYWVGRYDDRHVCSSCCEDSYRYGYGRNGNQYYIHEDDAEWVEGWDEYVDNNYLSDNNLIRLDNGDLCQEDDAVEIDDRWYHCEDERIVNDHEGNYRLVEDCVELENGDWCLEEDAWKCHATSDWYAFTDVEPVTIDGETYHPDDAPEQDEDAEDEVTAEQVTVSYPLPPDDERFALVA